MSGVVHQKTTWKCSTRPGVSGPPHCTHQWSTGACRGRNHHSKCISSFVRGDTLCTIVRGGGGGDPRTGIGAPPAPNLKETQHRNCTMIPMAWGICQVRGVPSQFHCDPPTKHQSKGERPRTRPRWPPLQCVQKRGLSGHSLAQATKVHSARVASVDALTSNLTKGFGCGAEILGIGPHSPRFTR